jgi:hypothetical protein
MLHKYAQFDELFATPVKPIKQLNIARIRDEARKRPAQQYVRNITTHADPNDYKGYETHAFNRANLSQVAKSYSASADSAARDEDDNLFFAV